MRRIFLPWFLGPVLAAAGCGGPSGSGVPLPPEEAALRDVGEIYRAYVLSKNRPPEKFADIASLKNIGPVGLEAVRSGAVVLRYGAAMTDTAEGRAGTPSDEILAFEKQAPESGGRVLLLDRTVRTMTAEEFKAAKKAGRD